MLIFFITSDRIAAVVPQILESVKGSSICEHQKRTQRTLQAYMEGAVFGDANYEQGKCVLKPPPCVNKLSVLTARRMKLSTSRCF